MSRKIQNVIDRKAIEAKIDILIRTIYALRAIYPEVDPNKIPGSVDIKHRLKNDLRAIMKYTAKGRRRPYWSSKKSFYEYMGTPYERCLGQYLTLEEQYEFGIAEPKISYRGESVLVTEAIQEMSDKIRDDMDADDYSIIFSDIHEVSTQEIEEQFFKFNSEIESRKRDDIINERIRRENEEARQQQIDNSYHRMTSNSYSGSKYSSSDNDDTTERSRTPDTYSDSSSSSSSYD